jgi:predicted secreted Zn-dependent protease
MWLSCCSADFAHARPSISVKRSFYPVSGRTAHDLKAQMKKAGPGAESKIWGDARTKWQVNWNYGLMQVSGGCRINGVTTSVHVTFIMPRWANQADGSPELKETWDKFVNALQKHEDGHKEHGIHAAQEIESEIARLQPMRSCGEVQSAANRRANTIIEKYRKKDLYYDILTIHGTTQGAVFR